MPQRLLFEGSDIDELLARVRLQHGPQARIVHAEQKLVGGMGGFFARRRYEVAVAIDDDPVDETVGETVEVPAPTLAGPPATLEELLAAADSQDGAPTGISPSADTVTPTAVPVFPPVAPPTPAPPTPPTPARAPGRYLSTESASFDHLVRDLIARAAPETRTSAPGFAASRTPAATASDVARIIDLDRPGPALPPTPVPPTPVSPTPVPPTPVPQLVLDLGLPVADATAPAPQDHRTSLLDILAAVAVAAPTQAGGVQVVVGPAGAGRQVVEAWLRLCGTDTAPVLDLSNADEPAVQDSPRELAERLERLEFQHGGVLIIVPAGDTRSQARAAGRRVGDLRADAVTAVVDARWDGAVVRAWLEALAAGGGPATHLAVYGIGESPTPLRLLEHGLPVTWLDARPATLGVWAGPCLDRWEEDATSADHG